MSENEGTKKRVLIVDDEEDMIWSLQKNLPTDNLPVVISTASSGEEALSVLETTEVDLIVTDIKMPGMSGIDLLIAVREHHPGIGVIVMTAFPSTESKAEVMEKGGLQFIEKPFDIKEMRDFVRTALKVDFPDKAKHIGIQLIDIVQVNNLAKATNALLVKAGGQEGIIYFSDGDIVHATCGNLTGEEAFYTLMGFQGETIETFYPDAFPDSTITTAVGALMLKAILLAEEISEDVDFLEEMDLDEPVRMEPESTQAEELDTPGEETAEENDFPAAICDPEVESFFEGEPEQQSDVMSDREFSTEVNNDDEKDDDKEEEMDELKELLGAFTNIPGVNTACLVGRDGFLLHSVALSGVDSEMIGAIASSGFGASEAMGNQLEKGSMSMTMVEYDNGPVMLAPVGSEAFLVIVADKDANLGMIRLKIKKHSLEIEKKAGI